MENFIPGLTEEEVRLLNEPFPPECLDTIQGFTYIPGDFVVQRLNEVFNYNWDCKQIYVKEGEKVADKKGTLVTPIFVGVELTVRSASGSVITRTGFGGSVLGYGKSEGDGHKGALTDALKKAAQSLGVGLYIAIDARAERKRNRGNNYNQRRGGGNRQQSQAAGNIPPPPPQMAGGQTNYQQVNAPSSNNNQSFVPPPPPPR